MPTEKTVILNEEQQFASDRLAEFLFIDEKEFSITGPAGTGKTTLMGVFIKEILPLYRKACSALGSKAQNYDIKYTATTHKAADVLAEATGEKVSTIHSFLNLTIKTNYQTGKQYLIKTNKWQPISNTLVFCDEASIIDKQLYQLINETLDNTCKIIYLGDDRQLTPVNEGISPVYNSEHIPFAELTQSMRNKGQPALMELCSQLRKTVKSGVFYPIREVPGVIEYLTQDNVEEFMETTFKQENAGSRALAFSNERVHEYLEYIRGIRGYPEEYTVGERLLFNSPFGKSVPAETKCIITEVGKEEKSLILNNNDTLSYKNIYVTLDNTNSEEKLNIPTDQEEFKECLQKFKKAKDWYSFYQLKDTVPDLRGTDAATVYKAQGSTYDSVLVDLDDINKASTRDQAARLLYVAISRARHKVFLWGRLSSRFFM